ncbi:hypothetical protein C8J57DRAFT_1481049 [Mycena rebaudengoi]|nr:hypothetical protein C8J57DRAFT_1481049 [Mycena rebaudengoi]
MALASCVVGCNAQGCDAANLRVAATHSNLVVRSSCRSIVTLSTVSAPGPKYWATQVASTNSICSAFIFIIPSVIRTCAANQQLLAVINLPRRDPESQFKHSKDPQGPAAHGFACSTNSFGLLRAVESPNPPHRAPGRFAAPLRRSMGLSPRCGVNALGIVPPNMLPFTDVGVECALHDYTDIDALALTVALDGGEGKHEPPLLQRSGVVNLTALVDCVDYGDLFGAEGESGAVVDSVGGVIVRVAQSKAARDHDRGPEQMKH